MSGATPAEAVAAWWQAMQDGDLAALGRLAAEDLVSSGGPGGRELGREALLRGAADFLAAATIDTWQTGDLEVRDLGDAAVCSYRWSERGVHAGRPFEMAGLATDVLRRRDGGWELVAHHVSPAPPDAG